jgi:hypothetical protein
MVCPSHCSANVSITLAHDAGQAAIESGLAAKGINTMASGDVGTGYKFFFFMQTVNGVSHAARAQQYPCLMISLFDGAGGSSAARDDRMQYDQSPSCSDLHCKRRRPTDHSCL